jgi:hypothetical protein
VKLLVCGGRDYDDKEFLFEFLDSVSFDIGDTPRKITHLIHGNARGADAFAHGWAVTRGVQPVMVPALWDLHGPSAGAMRNIAMLALGPDLVVAFPGGKGTAHMVRIAERAQVKVIKAPR